jgi:hypothetical protein
VNREGYTYSTDSGEWSETAGLNSQATVIRVAYALQNLLPLIPEDKVIYRSFDQNKSTEKSVWQALAAETNATYSSKYSNLFKNLDTNDLVWVTDTLAAELKKLSNWQFIRRGPAIMSTTSVKKDMKKKVIAASSVAAAAVGAAIIALL